jgi:general secretion pathway protein G
MRSPHSVIRWKAAGIKIGVISALGVFGLLILIATISTTACGCITKADGAKAFVNETIQIAISRYYHDNGSYPSNAESLTALLKAPDRVPNNWKGPYVDASLVGKYPQDPWGHDYLYRQPGTYNPQRYDVFSPGPDGIPDTSDDIGNW